MAFITIPSNTDLDEITSDNRLIGDVQNGLVQLHKTHPDLKNAIMEGYNLSMKLINESTGRNDYVVSKIEVLEPELIDNSHEYVFDTISAFVDGHDIEPELQNAIDSSIAAILVQYIFHMDDSGKSLHTRFVNIKCTDGSIYSGLLN